VAAPSALQAVALGARAAGRSAWLVAPGLLVAFFRWAMAWAAPAFALAMARAGAGAKLASGRPTPAAAVAGALAALTAPRTLLVTIGLAAAGLLGAAALRVAWVAGALPTLGGALSAPVPDRPRFAEGLAFGFAPVAGAWLLGLALEVLAHAFAWTSALAALLLALHPVRGPRLLAAAPAGLGAAALAGGVAFVLLAGLAADAALARAALSGDRPLRALTEGLRRVLSRPAAFLVAGLTLAAIALAVDAGTGAVTTAETGLIGGIPALLALGPRLLTAVLAAALATLLDLWRLATVAALAAADDP
jgi:hypothetical protein